MPETAASMLEGIEEGDLCRFVYKSPSGNGRWYVRKCVAVFLGRTKSRPAEFHVSFWPLAGTAKLNANHLMEVVKLDTL